MSFPLIICSHFSLWLVPNISCRSSEVSQMCITGQQVVPKCRFNVKFLPTESTMEVTYSRRIHSTGSSSCHIFLISLPFAITNSFIPLYSATKSFHPDPLGIVPSFASHSIFPSGCISKEYFPQRVSPCIPAQENLIGSVKS